MIRRLIFVYGSISGSSRKINYNTFQLCGCGSGFFFCNDPAFDLCTDTVGYIITILAKLGVSDPGTFDRDPAFDLHTDPDPDPAGYVITILSNWVVADPGTFDNDPAFDLCADPEPDPA